MRDAVAYTISAVSVIIMIIAAALLLVTSSVFVGCASNREVIRNTEQPLFTPPDPEDGRQIDYGFQTDTTMVLK